LIPNAYLQEWSARTPWPDPRQVEQDLIICRALCDLFSNEKLQGKIAIRGGTAINKLLFAKPLRYSEDIDLVQTQAEPIGATVDAIREALSWLGKPRSQQVPHCMHLVFKFTPEADDDAIVAFGELWGKLIRRIPGDPWKSSQAIIDEIRKKRIPALLNGIQY
jgi:Nucleotidyl transferase AbiEii toxin, Type IV TA system